MIKEEFTNNYFSWLPKNEVLIPFYSGVLSFIESHIDSNKLKKYNKPKDILDPCVGYVKLNSWEMAIIDTLLFQRLRKITQLGLAYQVYPTLRYSRMEHTIGVVGRLAQCLQRLKEKHQGEEDKININEIIDEYETQIRLAAIFHDVGHCLFSHLSESVINDLNGTDEYPSSYEIKTIFNKEFASHDSNLTIPEIFSITILGSKRVAEVLWQGNIFIPQKRNSNKIKSSPDIGKFLEQSARFIAGLPVENDARTIFLAQLISSGLDADKLDYMSREEHFSGIKIEMDLQRIFNKIKLFLITEETDLPKELNKYSKHIKNQESHKDFIVLGIEKGGQFSYEEFCVARLALYEKIYLHKKVRAAESFLKQKLEKLASETIEFQKVHNWLYLSESIIEKSHPYFETVIIKPKIDELDLETVVKNKKEIFFNDIEKREIPYRSFAFGPANAKTDNDISRDSEFGGIEENHLVLDSIRFWNYLNPKKKFKTKNPEKISEFNELILKEAAEIILKISSISASKNDTIHNLVKLFDHDTKKIKTTELHKQKEYEDIYREKIINQLQDSIIIDVPDYRRVQLKYESLHFEEASYQTVRWTIPIDQIARYYQLHRILAYVYTDLKYCPLILLATERVVYSYLPNVKMVYDQYQVVPKEIFNISTEIKLYLSENSEYYKEYEDLLPLNNKLLTVSAKSKINNVMHNLNKHIYFDSKKLTYLDVEKYLKQFDTKLQLPALNMISCIEMIDDGTLADEINKIMEKLNPTKSSDFKIGILPLGSYMSSSSHMMKKYNKFLEYSNIKPLHLSNVDDFLKFTHVIFIDDNINTGRQALNIIAKLMKIPDIKLRNDNMYLESIHNKNGEGETSSDDRIVRHLKEMSITFIFITGYEDSDIQLKNNLEKYCDIPRGNINIIIKNKLYENDKLFSGGSLTEEDEPEKNGKSIFRKVKENFKESPDSISDLKKFLEKVGREVVKSRGVCELYKQRPEDHCLGYCNRESLVIFPGSVPTMTITALWCSGTYDNGKKWKALIERPSNRK